MISNSPLHLTFFPNSNFSRGPKDIKILVGTTLRTGGSGGKYYEVEEVIRHEKHDRPRRAHDVALIRLKTPLEFNDKVQPIKVSSKKIKADETLLLPGFGSSRVSNVFICSVRNTKKRAFSNLNFIHSQRDQTQNIFKC